MHYPKNDAPPPARGDETRHFTEARYNTEINGRGGLMSGEVWTVLIIAGAVVIVLVLFRDRLRNFRLRADHKGVDVNLQGQPRKEAVGGAGGVVIQGNRQFGWKHLIGVGRRAIVRDNIQAGSDNKIVARPDPTSNGTSSPILEKKKQ
jgi:hypothetical protein